VPGVPGVSVGARGAPLSSGVEVGATGVGTLTEALVGGATGVSVTGIRHDRRSRGSDRSVGGSHMSIGGGGAVSPTLVQAVSLVSFTIHVQLLV
jgi:hypothetical protein